MNLIGNGTLITQNAAYPLIENGCVAYEGGNIVDFGTTDEMKAAYPQADFMDAAGCLIMPGLINCHTHIYSALARGISIPDSPVNHNFDDILNNLWWRLDRKLDMDDIRVSAYATYINSIKNGVTTAFDHHASMGCVEGSLFTIAEVAKQFGIRTSLCCEVSDRDGAEVSAATVKENADFIKYAQAQNNDMVKGMFGLHASFTIDDATLESCVKEMGDSNAGFHVHVAEGPSDVADALKRTGKRVVNRLYDFGILGDKSIAVHCIHITQSEMDLLKSTGTAVVHNPQSNMGNAVGCSPVIHMLERGLLVGMGTDAYTDDMLESMKQTGLIHKHHLCEPSVAWGEPPQMLFENNRAIAGRYFGKKLGIIEKGAAADIIALRYNPQTPLTAGNISGHLHFGTNGAMVDTSIIDGKLVMRGRQLVDIDEEACFAQSREQAKKLWARI